MPRKIYAPFILLSIGLALTLSLRANQTTITEKKLVRMTQEIMDAFATGNQEPFKKYYAEDAIFSDEKGRTMGKSALVKEIQPLPQGYSGTIKIEQPKSLIEANAAILNYDLDETEIVFGQRLHARYHQTDTWLLRGGKWQIVATQVLRYYEDPAPGKADSSKFPDYTGTYQLAPERTLTILVEDGHLYEQRKGRPREELIPEASDIFFRKGVEGRTLFGYDKNGKVTALIDRRNNEDILWTKVK